MWKRRRHFQKSAKISKKLTLILPFVLILLAIFFSIKVGFFTIKQIEIDTENLNCVNKNQLIEVSGILGQNFFFLDSVKITDNLKRKFLCIKSVNLKKILPNKIKLQLASRQALARLINLKEKEATTSSLIESAATPSAKNIGDSYLVDEENIVFSKDTGETGLPKIYSYTTKFNFGDNLTNNLVGPALKILSKVKVFNINTQQSWIEKGIFIIGQQGTGPTIVFSLDKDINIQLASLQLILTETKINGSKLEFIDLRFDKPIVKIAPNKKN